jgi:uncharacterized protein
MNKVVHFEIPADDRDRVKKFYSEAFDWDLQDQAFGEDVYTMAITSPLDENYMHKEKGAINGGIYTRTSELPNPIIVISVPYIDEHIPKIEAAGGKLVVPKGEVPEMGYYAYFKDSEGNLMGLWEDIKK